MHFTRFVSIIATFCIISSCTTPENPSSGTDNNGQQGNNQGNTSTAVAVTGVSLNKTEITLTEGDNETLSVNITPDNATDKTVTWSSSDTSVAKVENGKVSAVKEGKSTITAKAGGKSATCAVTVNAKVVSVTSIALKKTELNLIEGESETLTATISPDNATDKTITWSSSDASVAKVEDGIVTAVKKGKAIITAEAGTKQATCSVEVKAPSPSSISIEPSSLDIYLAQSVQLTYTVYPANAEYEGVEWESSDTDVVYVDNQGKVNGNALGSAVVRAKIIGTDISGQVSVTVNPVGVTSITIEAPSSQVLVGETLKLSVVFNPTNATNRKVKWSSNNPSVLSVDDNGQVSAYSVGKAVITAESEDSGTTDSITLDACDISSFVTCSTSVGTEGSTSSGFYSYLRLNLSVTNGKKINITSIMVVNQDNSVVDVKYSIGWVSDYTLKTITRTGTYYTYDAKGWWYEIKYTYDNKEYTKYHYVS
ncbi:MAG: Ig-like domain-containing protein [Prevotella sp.]|nr:Ig-like domain-containing protein [Prevotella sp.]